MTQKQPVRVLYFLNEWTTASGLVQLLISIIREMDNDRFRFDIIVPRNNIDDGLFSDILKAKEVRLIPLKHGPRHLLFGKSFKFVVSQFGPFDILHTLGHHISGHILREAEIRGIKHRVSHAENDLRQYYKDAKLIMRVYYELTKYWLKKYTTYGIATSRASAASMYGENWENDPRWTVKIILNGINLAPFSRNSDSQKMRLELGISSDAFILGNIGRLHYQKNHEFLFQVFAKVYEQDKNAVLLLVGNGPEQRRLENLAKQLEIQSVVKFLGSRQDVSDILQGVMDIFVFPSRFEGFGLALLEAQCAGLPCVYSDVIPPEACVVQPLLTPLSLQQTPEMWAEQILALKNYKPISKENAISQIEAAGLTQSTFAKSILQTYVSLIETNST